MSKTLKIEIAKYKVEYAHRLFTTYMRRKCWQFSSFVSCEDDKMSLSKNCFESRI